MSGKRYTDELKIEAVRQMTESAYPVKEVAQRLGVTTKSLYDWKAQFGDSSGRYQKDQATQEEMRRLKAELKRVTQERDILKEATAFFANESKKNTRS
jgi:transposase